MDNVPRTPLQDDEALRTAAYNGHLEVVKHLIGDDEALRTAAYNGHLEMVKCLIKEIKYPKKKKTY